MDDHLKLSRARELASHVFHWQQGPYGSIIYYRKGGPGIFFGGGTQKSFLLKGGIEDFHKEDFLGFILRLS